MCVHIHVTSSTPADWQTGSDARSATTVPFHDPTWSAICTTHIVPLASYPFQNAVCVVYHQRSEVISHILVGMCTPWPCITFLKSLPALFGESLCKPQFSTSRMLVLLGRMRTKMSQTLGSHWSARTALQVSSLVR